MLNRSRSSSTFSVNPRQSAHLSESQRLEEPLVLAGQVSLLQRLLDLLLRIFPLTNLLECVVVDDVLQALELESVTCGHDVVVVDLLDEWLDLGAFLDSLLAHAPGDFRRVALNASDQSEGERVLLCAGIDGLDDHDLKDLSVLLLRRAHATAAIFDRRHRRGVFSYLLAGIAPPSDDSHTADLEKLHLEPVVSVVFGRATTCRKSMRFRNFEQRVRWRSQSWLAKAAREASYAHLGQ
jgi:hypothetical protein